MGLKCSNLCENDLVSNYQNTSRLFKCPLPLTADLSLWLRVSSQILKPMLLYRRTEYSILWGARDMTKSFIFFCPILRAEALRRVFISWPFAQAPYSFSAVPSFSVTAWTHQTEVSLPAALVPRDRNLCIIRCMDDAPGFEQYKICMAEPGNPSWAGSCRSVRSRTSTPFSVHQNRKAFKRRLSKLFLPLLARTVKGQQHRQLVGKFTRIWADRGFIEIKLGGMQASLREVIVWLRGN